VKIGGIPSPRRSARFSRVLEEGTVENRERNGGAYKGGERKKEEGASELD